MARISSGMTHEALADRLGYSRAHITMLQCHKRRWTAEAIIKVCRVTGDMTPIQWLASQLGLSLYCDPIAQKRALLQAELDALDEQENAA